jgi:uncharacterized protein YdeI (YjbR/CyaY-like superfamily)
VVAKRSATPRRAGDDLPRVEVRSRAEWRRWLAAHHAQRNGIWLVTHKKTSYPDRYLSYDDIVEEALCHGWIDSLPRTLDAARSMRLVAPRRPKSAWSKVNKARVEKLLAEGKMAPAGLEVVAQAKADGSWARLDAVEAETVPPDLGRALRERPGAERHFEAFPRSSKRIILEWIDSARTAETRAKRIEETARLAAENRRAHHWRS